MPIVNLFRFVRRAAIAAMLMAGAVGTARADLVTGIWDPFFGGPFANLGFRGTATYFVPSACINSFDVRRVFNSDPCSNGAMRTLSFQVEFYDHSNEVQPTLQTLVFDPSQIAVNYIDLLEGFAGVGTGFSNWLAGTITFDSVSSYEFAVFSTGEGIPATIERSVDGAPPGPGQGTVQMLWKPAGSTQTTLDAFRAGQVSNIALPRFTIGPDNTVPEPGSLALVAAALLAAGCSAVRRRA